MGLVQVIYVVTVKGLVQVIYVVTVTGLEQVIYVVTVTGLVPGYLCSYCYGFGARLFM